MEDKINKQIAALDSLFKKQDDIYHKVSLWSGLSDAAYWVLYWIYKTDEPVIQSSLCNAGFFSKQTVNSAVAKLNSAGYVKLVAQNGKGNRKQLELTEGGQRFCEKHVKPLIKMERDSFEALTEEERELMLYLLDKQITAIGKGVEKLCQ